MQELNINKLIMTASLSQSILLLENKHVSSNAIDNMHVTVWELYLTEPAAFLFFTVEYKIVLLLSLQFLEHFLY